MPSSTVKVRISRAAIAVLLMLVLLATIRDAQTDATAVFAQFALAVALALVIRWAVIEPFDIPSASMRPTFKEGDHIFVNKCIYGLRYPLNHCRVPLLGWRLDYMRTRLAPGREPRRWEIVVFKSVEPDSPHHTLVKRVVGIPGETVRFRNGCLLVDGNALVIPDDVPMDPATVPDYPWGEWTWTVREGDTWCRVPAGHYFVLGDNLARSRDGRSFGWVPAEHIIGRVVCIWWPWRRRRRFRAR